MSSALDGDPKGRTWWNFGNRTSAYFPAKIFQIFDENRQFLELQLELQ